MGDEPAHVQRLRQRWAALDDAERVAITAAIVAAVIARLAEDPWYSAFAGPPRVEILGVTDRDGHVRIHFVADDRSYCYAQSGSDWAEHYLLAGDVELVAGQPQPVPVELADQIHLTEREWDDGYDPEPAFQRLRDRVLAKLAAAGA